METEHRPIDDLVAQLKAAMPHIKQWIGEQVGCHSTAGVSVQSLKQPNLARCFPKSLLRRAHIAFVDEVVFPPIAQWGLPIDVDDLQGPFDGITYGDFIFVRGGDVPESLYFHELVHVLQWDTLGVERFLLTYGVGLAQFGYRNSPLERIAYDLQLEFERKIYRRELVNDVASHAQEAWRMLGARVEQAR